MYKESLGKGVQEKESDRDRHLAADFRYFIICLLSLLFCFANVCDSSINLLCSPSNGQTADPAGRGKDSAIVSSNDPECSGNWFLLL